jgi:hypothetical protein
MPGTKRHATANGALDEQRGSMQEAGFTQRDCDILVIGGGRERRCRLLPGGARTAIDLVLSSSQPTPPASADSNP